MKKEERVYSRVSSRCLLTSCAFKIACRDISTSYPSKLHAITGILDSTTMLPMLITSPYTASSHSMLTLQLPYFFFPFFFSFSFSYERDKR